MGVQWTIGEAGERLAELVAAAQRGEEVALEREGRIVARIVGVTGTDPLSAEEIQARAARRRAAFGMYAKDFEGFDTSLEALKADRVDSDERFRRKFGAAD